MVAHLAMHAAGEVWLHALQQKSPPCGPHSCNSSADRSCQHGTAECAIVWRAHAASLVSAPTRLQPLSQCSPAYQDGHRHLSMPWWSGPAQVDRPHGTCHVYLASTLECIGTFSHDLPHALQQGYFPRAPAASSCPCPLPGPLQEEFARERAMVDDVVARIEAEDRAEHEARRQRQRDTHAYVQNFLAEQTQLKQRRQEELEEEDRRCAGAPSKGCQAVSRKYFRGPQVCRGSWHGLPGFEPVALFWARGPAGLWESH